MKQLSERIRKLVGDIRHFIPLKTWESLWDMTDEVAKAEEENEALKEEIKNILDSVDPGTTSLPLSETSLNILSTGEEK